MPQLKRANHWKKAAWPGLETDLLGWIKEKRNNGLAILSSLVWLKALEMAKDEKYGIPAGHFKAGNCWCQGFMKRNGLQLRQKTTLAQRLPEDYEEKIIRFHCFVINLRKEHNYPLHVIANMDETSLTFDMPPILVKPPMMSSLYSQKRIISKTKKDILKRMPFFYTLTL